MNSRVVVSCLTVAVLFGCSDQGIRSGTVESTDTPRPAGSTSNSEAVEPDDGPTTSVPGTDLLVAVPPDWDEISVEEYEEQVRTFISSVGGEKADPALRELEQLVDNNVIRTVFRGEVTGFQCWIQILVRPHTGTLEEAVTRRQRQVEGYDVTLDESSRDRVQVDIGTAIRLERVYTGQNETSVPAKDVEYLFLVDRQLVTVVVTAPASATELEGLMAEFMDGFELQPH